MVQNNAGTIDLAYDSVSVSYFWVGDTYVDGTLADPHPSATDGGARDYSIYITYTATGGGRKLRISTVFLQMKTSRLSVKRSSKRLEFDQGLATISTSFSIPLCRRRT